MESYKVLVMFQSLGQMKDSYIKYTYMDIVAPVVENLPANAGSTRDVDLIAGLGRSPGVRNSTLLQYSCLENSMGRGALWTTVCEVAKSWTRLSTLCVMDIHTNILHIFLFYQILNFKLYWQHHNCHKLEFSLIYNILTAFLKKYYYFLAGIMKQKLLRNKEYTAG